MNEASQSIPSRGSSPLFFSWLIIAVSCLLALFEMLFLSPHLKGLGNILFYLLALIPLCYLALTHQIHNRYTVWILPFLGIWIFNIFIYNNTLTQSFLPFIVMSVIVILYLTSMHNVDGLHQALLPKVDFSLPFLSYIGNFFAHIFSLNVNLSVYKRIAIALLITLPFAGVFLMLFIDADIKFHLAINQFTHFFTLLNFNQLAQIPFFFLCYLSLFLYSYFNHAQRLVTENKNAFDPLIVGIFLGTLNLLFSLFLLFQVAYLFGGEAYIRQSNIPPAMFAREGFFQLALIMSLVILIFLSIMRRYQGERSIKLLMSFLMAQTLIIGITALKKMYLYQDLLGATTLRYYVEWFEYFLIAVLVIGIVFTLIHRSFHETLSTVTAMGLVAFSLVTSLNIDAMVASSHVKKFSQTPSSLDTLMLSRLSIDALPVIENLPIKLEANFFTNSCDSLMQYHLGRCQLIQRYGYTHLRDTFHH